MHAGEEVVGVRGGGGVEDEEGDGGGGEVVDFAELAGEVVGQGQVGTHGAEGVVDAVLVDVAQQFEAPPLAGPAAQGRLLRERTH